MSAPLLSLDNVTVEYLVGGKTLSAVSEVSLSVARVAMTRSCRAMWSECAWLTKTNSSFGQCGSSQSRRCGK